MAPRVVAVIVGAILGTWLFKERFGGPRVAATTLLAAGFAMMLLGG